jgi:hypothetical protein
MGNNGSNPGDHAVSAAAPKDFGLVDRIIAAQNADGGWPYQKGSSWTEPTVLALLALGPHDATACARGFAWLRSRQRADGGWPPQSAVDQTTWVTSLVAFLPPEAIGPDNFHSALKCILQQMGTNSTFWYHLRERLLGTNSAEENPGWPWFPGTAAWVTPTALAILALEKVEKKQPSPEIRQRVEKGRRFLMARRCADAGWNHGSSHALGYEGNSYPETTGAALLALRGVSGLDKSIAAAEAHWPLCRSAEGAAWLKMALLAHGRKAEGWPDHSAPRNIRDTALCVLADRAERGNDAFLD